MYHVRLLCGLRSISQCRPISKLLCARLIHPSSSFQRMFVAFSRNGHRNLPQAECIRRSFANTETNKISHQNIVRHASASAGPSENGRLVYSGTLAKSVLGVKFFSYSCSMFSVCVLPPIMMQTGLGLQSLAMQVVFCVFVGFFTFITPVLLHLMTKGYVVRLYHNEETDMYTAITYSALLVEKKTVFHQSDVRVPEISKMFTTFYAKKHSMLVNPDSFGVPHDYNHLMGYDRPFTFDVDDLDKPNKK